MIGPRGIERVIGKLIPDSPYAIIMKKGFHHPSENRCGALKGKSNSEVFSIPPSSAKAFEVKRGSFMKIINTDGSLVGDLVSFVVASGLKEKVLRGQDEDRERHGISCD